MERLIRNAQETKKEVKMFKMSEIHLICKSKDFEPCTVFQKSRKITKNHRECIFKNTYII